MSNKNNINSIRSTFERLTIPRGQSKIKNLNKASNINMEPRDIRNVYKQNLKSTRLAYNNNQRYWKDKEVKIDAQRSCPGGSNACWHRTKGSRDQNSNKLCGCYKLPHGKRLNFVD